ncbi:Glutathione hydrolase proenzyme 1 [Dictyocoela muelleri]|nr:Glutathione hydrolase proenzyme 1 [Dictyocoela muelleri]
MLIILIQQILTTESLFPGINKTESFKHGAVSTESPICSKMGIEILKEGGNAVDTAITCAICVGIVNSFSSGIGGGGFMVIKGINKIDNEKPENGNKGDDKEDTEIIDFRETAPEKIRVKDFKSSINSQKGGLSVGVPGEIKGFYYAHKKYGKLPWKKLYEKNIFLAKNFRVTDQLYQRLKKLQKYVLADPGLSEIYSKNGEIVKEGDTISRENLSKTLKIISENPMDFYEGEIADKIIKSVNEHGGKFKKEDLLNYKPKNRKVIEGTYKNFKVITAGLPSGGLFVVQALNILENFNLNGLKEIGERTNTFPHYHLLVETFKFIAAKRGLYGDPDFINEDFIDEIVSKENAKLIAQKIDFNRTLPVNKYEPVDFQEDHGTTHLNVIDKNNMIVLITSSVNLEFGGKFMDTETGIIFNDVIDDFYIPNVKNAYGLEKMSANKIEPLKRPFSSASPIILMNDDEILALGAAGGTRIPTSVVGVIFHLVLGKTLNEAIMEPRIHHQLLPNFVFIENTIDPEIRRYLEELGHKVKVSKRNTVFTSVQGLHVKLKGTRKIQVFSDVRKGGLSDGY